MAWRLNFLCISFVCLFEREGVFIIGKTQFVRREVGKYEEYAYLRKLHVKRAHGYAIFVENLSVDLKIILGLVVNIIYRFDTFTCMFLSSVLPVAND